MIAAVFAVAAKTIEAVKAHPRKSAALALAAAIAIPAEGLRQYAYRDPVGILTVCYGTTGADVKAGKQYSLNECRALLEREMVAAIETVERCAPGLPSHQLAAFADAVYNIGPRIVCDAKQSSVARALQAGDVNTACQNLKAWDKARVGGQLVALPGLTKRRAKEAQLCLTGSLAGSL